MNTKKYFFFLFVLGFSFAPLSSFCGDTNTVELTQEQYQGLVDSIKKLASDMTNIVDSIRLQVHH